MATKLDREGGLVIGAFVTICSHLTNRECYISNSTRPMNTKLDKTMTYDVEPPPKILNYP